MYGLFFQFFRGIDSLQGWSDFNQHPIGIQAFKSIEFNYFPSFGDCAFSIMGESGIHVRMAIGLACCKTIRLPQI